MKAGTLEIELITNIARLQKDMRDVQRAVGGMTSDVARNVKAANDNLATMGKGAGAGVREFSRDVAALKASIDPAWAAMQRYKGEVKLLQQALGQGAITHKQYVEQLRLSVTAMRSAGQSASEATGAQRAGMQQLSMNLGDMATMYAMGARPMQIFASQSAQIIQALQLMTGGTSRLAGFLGGPWGMAITAAAMVLLPLISKLFETSDAMENVKVSSNALSDVQGYLSGVFDITTGKMQTQTSAALALAKAQIILAQAQSQSRLAESRRQIAASGEKQWQFGGGMGGGFTIGRARPIEGQIASQFQNGVIDYSQAIDGLKRLHDAGKITQDQFASLSVTYANAGVEVENQKVLNEAYASILDGKLAPSLRKAEAAHKAKKEAMSDAERAYKQAYEAAEKYIENLEIEIQKIGKAPEQIRALEIARAKEAAATDMQRQKIEELSAAREAALAAEKVQEATRKAMSDTDDLRKQVDAIEREAQAIGLVGWEREKLLLRMENEAQVREKLISIAIAEAAGNSALADELRRQLDLIQQINGQKIQNGEMADRLEKDRAAAERMNAELERMIGLLQGLGGVGSAIGSALAFLNGKDSSIGGPLGGLLQTQTGMKPELDVLGEKTGREISKTLGDEMRELFGLNGEFGKTMGSLLQGAGVGMQAASTLFGKQSTTEQIGSALGGAAGKVLGTAIAGPLGGAIGSIAGGLLGSAVGSLFGTKHYYGSAVVTGMGKDDVTTGGNKNAYTQAASTAATSIQSGLQSIADAFGANIGAFQVAIGQYDGKWRVNTTGVAGDMNFKGNSAIGLHSFGEDGAEAAVKFAIADAIKDGALLGLRAGTQALLQDGDDIDVQLQKALSFEGVFTALEQAADPAAYAVKQLNKQFDGLRDIFKEAGATTAEYAQLQQYYDQQRQAQIDEERQRLVEELSNKRSMEIQILELLGRSEEALAASRELELAGLKSTLQPLQQMIYQLQDARDIIDQFGPLADDLRKFRQEVLGGQSASSVAAITAQFRSTATAAYGGDAGAMSALRGDANAYLEAMKANAGSSLEYQRAVSEVLKAVDGGIFAADAKVDFAQLQIDAINANADILTSIDFGIDGLNDTLEQWTASPSVTSGTDTPAAESAAVDRFSSRLEAMIASNGKMAESIAQLERRWQRMEADGILIRTDSDTPIQVEAVTP